jgi:hypothetical protein
MFISLPLVVLLLVLSGLGVLMTTCIIAVCWALPDLNKDEERP